MPKSFHDMQGGVKRGAPLGFTRAKRGWYTSLEANGRPCRVWGDAEVRNRRVWIDMDVSGFLVLPHPPDAARTPFAICSVGEKMGSGTVDCDRSVQFEVGALVTPLALRQGELRS